MRGLLTAFLLFCCIAAQGQSIRILPGATFHDATWSSEFGELEDTGSPDEGGLVYLMLENTTSTDLGIMQVEVEDAQGNAQSFDGWMAWPELMTSDNGNLTTLMVKAIGPPLAEGEDARIIVTTSDNAVHTFEMNDLTTPDLRLTNFIPSEDRSALWAYLRNDGAEEVSLDSIYLNQIGIPLFATGQLATLFGGSTIAPGETRIINIQAGLDLADLTPYAIRVKYNGNKWVSAGIRIVAPYFPIGSWHSSGMNPENEEGRKRMRRMGVQSLHGPNNYGLIAGGHSRYHIQVIREPSFSDPFDPTPAIAEVQAQAENPAVLAWTVDDEPDLNGKPIDQQLIKAQTYRQNDSNTPTHVNLAVQKKYQRYGWYTDIVSMDHYAAPSAPNVIPLTYVPVVGRMSEVEEAYDYSRQLKLNTEPRRMWSWVQFAGSVWDVQPEPVAINYQFWAHLAAGAKGMEWFVSQSNTADAFPNAYQEGLKLFKEFKQIRNACLYGEPSDIVTSSNPNVLTYALQGPEAIVVFALNNSLEFDGNGLSGYTTDYSEEGYSLTVDVPEWFTYDDIYQLTVDGRSDVSHFASDPSNPVALLPHPLTDRMHVFVIAKADTEAPQALEGLNVSEYVDSANYTLSWKEPFDNIGVEGYLIHYNGIQVADVKPPIFEVDSQTIACSGHYRVTPYDNAGNLGQPDSVEFILSGPELEILEHPSDTAIGWNHTLSLHVETNVMAGYQWQWIESGASTWSDIVDDGEYIFGALTNTLTMNSAAAGLGASFRCVVHDLCGEQVISNEAHVSILGIDELGSGRLNAYPNPTNGTVIIAFEQGKSEGELTVMDVAGRTIFTEQVTARTGQMAINLTEHSDGIYLFRFINTEGNLFTQHIILQR